MFFNQDILFRNGSLALIWMAGNEEFKNKKNRRNKDFQAALNTNVITVCKDLRALFPNMGSAYGLSLKKMGTLVKGLGIIYSIKIEQLARDIYQATISLKRPVTLAQIDMPKTTSKSKTTTANKAGDNQAENEGFGEFEEGIPANFGNLDFEEGAFGTPRALPSRLSHGELEGGASRRVLFTPPRTLSDEEQQLEDRRRQRSSRKRQRDEADNEEAMYREVCRKLRSGLNEDAHCMREDDNIFLPDNNGNEYDFGNGEDLLNGVDPLNDGLPGADLQPTAGAGPDEISSGAGIGLPSAMEYEDQLRSMGTPTGAGTRPQNSRRPRNEGREADETMMELGEVDEVATTRRLRTVRKRLRLDRTANFTLEEMLLRINAVKDATTMDLLQRQLVRDRAPGKSEWKYVYGKVEDFMRSAGRPCQSRALNEMIQETMNNQVKRRATHPVELERNRGEPSIEIGRAEAPNPEFSNDADAGISVTGAVPDRTDAEVAEPHIDPPGGQQNEYDGSPQQFPQMELGLDGDEGVGSVAQDDGVMGPEERHRRRKSRDSRNEEQSKLSNRLHESNIFADLFPPRQVTRKKAAMAFYMLLKMQAKKEVFLRENEPYGPIRIDQLKG